MSVILRRIAPPVLILALAACSGNPFTRTEAPVDPAPAAPAPDAKVAATTRPAGSGVSIGTGPGKSAEALDTTTGKERAAAATPSAPVSDKLGRTIASLGDPAETGFWLKTPLVTSTRKGRVEDADTGKTAEVELRPSGGARGSGSQLSLAAMRLLGVPLTGLPELVVYTR